VINLESITRNCGGDSALVAELAQVFLEECSSYILLLDQAMSERSSEGVGFAAHRLRGSLAIFDLQTAHMPDGDAVTYQFVAALS
jgi:HPt (histidine-containing phosphotransfer) domain-containing protein